MNERAAIWNYMVGAVDDESTATELAENTAIDLGHVEWLNDENHIVWDLAVNMIEVHNKCMTI